MIATIIIFILMIVSFSINKIPMALTSVLGMIALVLTGSIESSAVLSNIGSNVVITLISMFIVSAGLAKTQMSENITKLVFKVTEGSFRSVLAGYVIITFILGQFLPTTTVIIATMVPLVVSMCKEMKVNPSKMLYSIALVTIATSWTFTPIGPYASNYIEANGMIAEFGLSGYEFTIFDEMIDKIPTTIFVLIWAIFFAPTFAPNIPAKDIDMNITNISHTKAKLPLYKEVLGYGVFIAVIICLMFNSFGLQSWIFPAIGACILVFTGVLSEKEAIHSMGLNVIMIYIGAITLGQAFANTGAGEFIGNMVVNIIGTNTNPYFIGAIYFTAAYVMTSLLYNRAVSKILIPIVLLSCISMNVDPRGLMRLCYIGSMCSLITPMSTSAVPIIMGAAGYSQKDLVVMNIIPAILMGLVSVLFVMTKYPL